MNVEEALREAGFVFVPNVMQPEFDYPLDFWERERDGIRILGSLAWFGSEDNARILLYPGDDWYEWDVMGDIPENLVQEFTAAYDILADKYKDMQ